MLNTFLLYAIMNISLLRFRVGDLTFLIMLHGQLFNLKFYFIFLAKLKILILVSLGFMVFLLVCSMCLSNILKLHHNTMYFELATTSYVNHILTLLL